MKDFTQELKELPKEPGVYLMFDANQDIIYVGKAVSLANRVRSYFQKNKSGKSPKVLAMVEQVDYFEYIVVENEVEALILESNFIKEHAPKYNILLRDDKQYPYVHIPKESFPRLLKVRKVSDDGGRYFGPYPNAYAVNDTIALLQRIFCIRNCNLDFDKGARRDRPCLNYYIDQCKAPCMGWADEKEYMANIEKVVAFLNGKDRSLQDFLKAEMEKAAEELNFERAAKFRDEWLNLEALQEKQKVTLISGRDSDIIAMARGSNSITLQVFFMRSGKIVDREHFTIRDSYQEPLGEVLSSFLKQFYVDRKFIPPEILLETRPTDEEAITAFLTQRRGMKVTLHVPKRGEKSRILDRVRSNAEEQLLRQEKREEKKERNKDRGIKALQEVLGISSIKRIEAYDVSNIAGVSNVGSMVVYEGEKKVPKEYRKFRIQTVEGPDEYASQREMLSRRFDRGICAQAEGATQTGFGALPDLILMDGGKGQVNVCLEVLRERNLSIPVCGLVKDDRHRTKALIYENCEIPLEVRTPLYRFLYALQEEVHRFAINYHRKVREKAMVKSELDDIPGIGMKRKRALLKEFGSVEKIKEADVEALVEVTGMNRRAAQSVWEYFRSKEA